MITPEVRDRLIALARQAATAILDVYNSSDFGVEVKEDASPLTRADRASHQVLTALDGYLGLPLISEEDAVPEFEERKDWAAYWLIDPLDGTKEFIQRNGDFTVNIALIQNGKPTFGVVNVPVTGVTYLGGAGEGSIRMDGDEVVSIHAANEPTTPIRVVASRNHRNEATDAFIETLGPAEVIPAGSSLKFCRIAEGDADVYPRMAPTMEWDTAAAQAIVEGAGGHVLTRGEPLAYNREELRNPNFVACAPWFAKQHASAVGVA